MGGSGRSLSASHDGDCINGGAAGWTGQTNARRGSAQCRQRRCQRVYGRDELWAPLDTLVSGRRTSHRATRLERNTSSRPLLDVQRVLVSGRCSGQSFECRDAWLGRVGRDGREGAVGVTRVQARVGGEGGGYGCQNGGVDARKLNLGSEWTRRVGVWRVMVELGVKVARS